MNDFSSLEQQLREIVSRLPPEISESLASALNSTATATRNPNAPSSSPQPATCYGNFKQLADAYINFTYENPTTYHAVQYVSRTLEQHGFKYLNERKDWSNDLSRHHGGKFYTTRNGTSVAAFIVGDKWVPQRGAGIIGCHTDSLCAKLKPASIKHDIEGFELLGVAPYSGALEECWFDRDLGIGGRVLVRENVDGEGFSKNVKAVLIDSSPHPVAKIPSLAPHFGKVADGPYDKEDQAVPIVGFSSSTDDFETQAVTEEEKMSPLYGKHPINLLRYVAKLAGVKVSQLMEWDLELFDVQRGNVGGLNDEFIFAPRMDDKLCTFAALHALCKFADTVRTSDYDNLVLLGLFDNEEIGSRTRQGASGPVLAATLERLADAVAGATEADMRVLLANSIILSADVTHMFNPDFKNVYLEHHSPRPNYGITVKIDPNLHMATDNVGLAFVEELGRKNGDRIQYFHIKNNSQAGSTIGPELALSGARTVDVGIPQLAMHRIRAVTGTKDVWLGMKFFSHFYRDWKEVYDKFGDL